ncbi:membrane protein [Streptomyces polychromogenes]|uniref:Membrane protein n=1 Tax=Streptomyces polychromogenes TaxID=67342 RepID=A0ABN0VHK6_9ACTN
MGIESDHLVYEYLSRVGDLAQQRQLSSGDRMRLVAGLRDEIDRRRARFEPETPEAVRAVLERLGTPEEVLAEAARAAEPAAAPDPAPASVPVQRGNRRRPKSAPAPEPQNVPPHLAGLDELGGASSGDGEPDWWRLPSTGRGPQVEGFAGGIEIPELLGLPDEEEPKPTAPPGPAPEGGGLLRHLRKRRERREAARAADADQAGPAKTPRPRPHGFLLLSALLLAAGALTGYWPLLGAGALVAYVSRVLGPLERKWVILGVPAGVFTAAMLWLWGRTTGRWGDPLPTDQLGPAFQSMWPALARTAGAVLAAYLTWRSRRR